MKLSENNPVFNCNKSLAPDVCVGAASIDCVSSSSFCGWAAACGAARWLVLAWLLGGARAGGGVCCIAVVTDAGGGAFPCFFRYEEI